MKKEIRKKRINTKTRDKKFIAWSTEKRKKEPCSKCSSQILDKSGRNSDGKTSELAGCFRASDFEVRCVVSTFANASYIDEE